jgi:cation-transporting ATPase I
VGLPGPGRLARLAAGTALHVTATGIGLAAGTASLAGSLVAPPVRQARATAGAVAESAGYTATVLAKAGARAVGAVVTGVDDATDGNLERLTEAGKAMFEPPAARRSRRVWVSRGRAHLELAAPAVAGGPSVRRALRRQLERLDGVEWAAVNDAVGRVLVTFDERRVRVDDVVEVIAAIEQARAARRSSRSTPSIPPTSSRWSRRWSPSPWTPSASASPTPAGCCRCPGSPGTQPSLWPSSTASSGSGRRWLPGSAPPART